MKKGETCAPWRWPHLLDALASALTDAIIFLAASAGFRDLWLIGKRTVDGKGAGAFDHNGQGDSEGEKMILDAFALLIASPVCEQAEVAMHHDHGDQHIASDAESGHAAKQADNQADAAEKFGADGQEGQGRRDMHGVGEKAHGAGESVAAEPAEGFLRAVGEKDYTEDQAKNGDDRIASGVDELAKHELASLSLEEMGGREWEMLHRFGFEEDAKAVDGRVRGILEIKQIFERKFLEACGGESAEFRAGERLGHLAFRIGRFTAACDDKQVPARAGESRSILDGSGAECGWQNLECVCRTNRWGHPSD
jgi:hypothetical protein